ncbi:MAG: hypothetical protein ACE5JR_10155 [Gemmatimonadota bacterium]
MTDPSDAGRGFPEWLESLRPDDMTRARLRRSILAEAQPLLTARCRGSWWEVASGWATLLAPTAAALALLFGALAYRAGPPATRAEGPPRVEELVAASPNELLPPVLTADSASGADLVLTAAIYAGER